MSTNANNQQPNSLLEISCVYFESISNHLQKHIQQANMINWKYVKLAMTEYLDRTSGVLEQTFKEHPAPAVPNIAIADDFFNALKNSIDDLKKLVTDSYTLGQLHSALNEFQESTKQLKSYI